MNRYQVKKTSGAYGVYDVIDGEWIENILNERVMAKKMAEQLAADLNR